MKGKIKFVDRLGQSTHISIHNLDAADPNQLSRLDTFALTLRSYSNAAIPEVSVSRPNIVGVSGQNAAVGEYDSSFHKAILRFRYVENSENKSLALHIPAPNSAQFTEVQDVGYRFLQGDGDAIAAALATATGIADLTFVEGIMDYRGGKSIRPTDGAFVYFKDAHGRYQYMGVPAVTDVGALGTFANALFVGSSNVTMAAVVAYGIITPEFAFRTDTPDTEQYFDAVEGRAVMRFSYLDGTDKRNVQLTLPAVKESALSFQGQKEKLPVSEAVGDLIAIGLSSLFNNTVEFKFEGGVRDKVRLEVA